jgi:hypothetical protein
MMFKLSQEPGRLGLRCDAEGLSLAGVPLLVRNGDRFQPRSAIEIQRLLSRAYQAEIWWVNRIEGIGAVARALNEGDMVRAMITAVRLKLPELDWEGAVRIASAEDALAKDNFNPDEPRDWHGRWTTGDGGADPSISALPIHTPARSSDGASGEVVDVVYQGTYHDQLVKNLADYLRANGCTVLTEVPLTGVDGVTARADLLVQAPDKGLPIVIEVKTGLDPKYTEAQRSIYPLAVVGGHVTSFDPRVSQVGLVPGNQFPPLSVFTTYQRGPGFPLQTDRIDPEFVP